MTHWCNSELALTAVGVSGSNVFQKHTKPHLDLILFSFRWCEG